MNYKQIVKKAMDRTLGEYDEKAILIQLLNSQIQRCDEREFDLMQYEIKRSGEETVITIRNCQIGFVFNGDNELIGMFNYKQ